MTTIFRDCLSHGRTLTAHSIKELASLPVLLAAMGFAGTLACGLAGDDKKADTTTDTNALAPAQPGGVTPNGLSMPAVQDWGVVGVAARSDSGELHVIVGNETAVTAARSGATNPWPEGTALSHLVWKAEKNPFDPDQVTIGPGAFQAVTLMMKDSTKYAADGGWAYGLWSGTDLTPPADPTFDRACVNCHTSLVKDRDYVFTNPGDLPDLATIEGAAAGANGVAFPSKILDWRVIGVADVLANAAGTNKPTIRVIVGNPTAVTAARSGQTDPWPDGSLISHFVWAPGDNPVAADTTAPVGFGAITLMQRSSTNYAADGDWAYGVWQTKALTPLGDGGDRQCVTCHTDNVANRDMVFSQVAEFPPMMLPGATVAR